ncbi:MAG: aspartate aminotransferase family protein [Rhodospirillaceae bacterium]|nr:aspartate aminotransferase family protein [Rhodospirillaceae bacterium]MBT5300411.1 aspartate aminotransferase family protein [Rhodospirillaceae bacterium]MBT6085710.1 aspartate aminotransferase family protein [Rhodospirillaceae bacterium]MBT6609766.1 aspartate aminotransferase family protein [Rhodospirillaceae bacterium]MBT6885291.1 aspartate aminotransferase family protein [Rhodospirillaceae bacterium]
MIDAVMPTYARYDVTLERGEGVYAFSTDGRRFLDFGAGIAVASLGHCHPHLVDALKSQAETLWHCSNLYHIPGQERLAERLVSHTFADAVFFNNSGGEAVEMGFKMMRKYHAEAGHPERYRVISVEGAFHGRSLACISSGRQEKHTAGFGPLVDGFDQVAFGNMNEMRAAITPETAGIVIEPVQGEGGIRPVDADYLKELRAVADEFGILLMYDEVQCGIGRTGKLYAHEWSGAAPDILASAKGLGGGFPIGATLATEAVADAMKAGSHGSTFGGNPLAMAVGNAVVDVVLADGFMDNVTARAEQLANGLDALVKKYPDILAGHRGMGLMQGLQCQGENGENGTLVGKLMAGGLLTVPAGDNIVRMVPPLTIEATHVEEALSILDAAVGEMTTKAA